METVLAIDNDKNACATYAANFPGVRVECAPVADLVDSLPHADVIIGGPPCQPFSLAGEGEGASDDRDCIPDFVDAVLKVRPRMFLMENVPNLLSARHIGHLGKHIAHLDREGYEIRHMELDAVSFGVPQFRNRVWVWGIAKTAIVADGIWFKWPRPTHAWPPPTPSMYGGELEPGITVRQALGLDGMLHRKRGKGMLERGGDRRDHPVDEPCPSITSAFALGGGGGIFLKSGPNPDDSFNIADFDPTGIEFPPSLESPDRLLARLQVVGGGSNPHFIGDQRTERDITDEPSTTISRAGGNALPQIAVEKTLDKPCRTISAGSHAGGPEPVNNRIREGFLRRLTPLECARIQSVPDDFLWPDGITKTAKYGIVGNGWASRMGAVFADAFSRTDPKSRTMIDLFCGGGLGAVGWHGRYWSYERDVLGKGGVKC